MLLNEVGVYVESESNLKTTEVGGRFSQDFVENIATISAGITKLEVKDEKWNGETFWMRASITIDKKSFEESINQLIQNRQKTKEFDELKLKLDDACKVIDRLKDELSKNQTIDKTEQLEKYNNEIKTLSAADYFYNALAKYYRQDYQGAIADYNKAIELDPEPSAYTNRGVIKANLQDYQGAIADYNRAIELDPKYVLAYYNRGNAKGTLQDYRASIADYSRAIELDPKDADIYTNRGTSKAKLQDYQGAIEDYNRAIELDPKYADAYLFRGITRIRIGDENRGCLDLSKAGELGNAKAYEAIRKLCN